MIGWLCLIFALRQGRMSLRLASNLFLAKNNLELLPISSTSRHVPPCPVLKWLSGSCVMGSLSLHLLLSLCGSVQSRGRGLYTGQWGRKWLELGHTEGVRLLPQVSIFSDLK